MIHIYAAGNFVLMSDPEKEKRFIREVKKRTGSCNRLISFFFKKELKVIMDIHTDVKEKEPVLIRRKKKVPRIKKFRLTIKNKEVASGLTEQEIWFRLGKHPIGIPYEVYNIDGTLTKEFVPF